MATRNERKARAKARKDALIQAVIEAERLEIERLQVIIRRTKALTDRPERSNPLTHPHERHDRTLRERRGRIVSGSFQPTLPPLFVPLKGDGHDGKGELRKRWTKG